MGRLIKLLVVSCLAVILFSGASSGLPNSGEILGEAPYQNYRDEPSEVEDNASHLDNVDTEGTTGDVAENQSGDIMRRRNKMYLYVLSSNSDKKPAHFQGMDANQDMDVRGRIEDRQLLPSQSPDKNSRIPSNTNKGVVLQMNLNKNNDISTARTNHNANEDYFLRTRDSLNRRYGYNEMNDNNGNVIDFGQARTLFSDRNINRGALDRSDYIDILRSLAIGNGRTGNYLGGRSFVNNVHYHPKIHQPADGNNVENRAPSSINAILRRNSPFNIIREHLRKSGMLGKKIHIHGEGNLNRAFTTHGNRNRDSKHHNFIDINNMFDDVSSSDTYSRFTTSPRSHQLSEKYFDRLASKNYFPREQSFQRNIYTGQGDRDNYVSRKLGHENNRVIMSETPRRQKVHRKCQVVYSPFLNYGRGQLICDSYTQLPYGVPMRGIVKQSGENVLGSIKFNPPRDDKIQTWRILPTQENNLIIGGLGSLGRSNIDPLLGSRSVSRTTDSSIGNRVSRTTDPWVVSHIVSGIHHSLGNRKVVKRTINQIREKGQINKSQNFLDDGKISSEDRGLYERRASLRRYLKFPDGVDIISRPLGTSGNEILSITTDHSTGSDYVDRHLESRLGNNIVSRPFYAFGGSNFVRRQLDPLRRINIFTRTLDPLGGSNLVSRQLDPLGGSNIVSRTLDSLDGSNLVSRGLDSLGGSNIVSRTTDFMGKNNIVSASLSPLGGSNVVSRGLDPLGESNIVSRTLDPLGGGHIVSRGLVPLGGSNTVSRTLDPLSGSYLIIRGLDPLRGSNPVSRALDPFGGSNLISRGLDPLGGSHIVSRALDPFDGSNLVRRGLDPLGGSNIVSRTFDLLGGSNLVSRDLYPFGRSNIVSRTVDPLGGSNLVSRHLDPLGGSNIVSRTLDPLGGSNLVSRGLDPLGGSNIVSRTVDFLDGSDIVSGLQSPLGGSNLVSRGLDPLGGSNIVSRTLDPLGGSNLVSRSLDPLGGNNIVSRTLDPMVGSKLVSRGLAQLGGSNIVSRTLDRLDGSIPVSRSLDPLGGSNIVSRTLDPMVGSILGSRSLDPLGGSNIVSRTLEPLEESNLVSRDLDTLGGNNIVSRTLDPLGGSSLVSRDLDTLGGNNIVSRTLDPLGGSNLISRDLDSLSEISGARDLSNNDGLFGRSVGLLAGGVISRRTLEPVVESEQSNNQLDPVSGSKIVNRTVDSQGTYKQLDLPDGKIVDPIPEEIVVKEQLERLRDSNTDGKLAEGK